MVARAASPFALPSTATTRSLLRTSRTLRWRFELPWALRPTRSQVWRVGPSFATSASRHRPRREIPSLVRSARRPQRLDIEFERHDGLDQAVGLQDSRVDLPESTDLATVQNDRGRPSREEISILDRLHVRSPPDVPHQAEDQRLRLRERGLVMDRRRPGTPQYRCLEDDICDLEDPLRQFAVLVQTEDVHQRREHRRAEGREILVQRVPDRDAIRRLEGVL